MISWQRKVTWIYVRNKTFWTLFIEVLEHPLGCRNNGFLGKILANDVRSATSYQENNGIS